mgnify:CR=1 FL=1
MADLNKIIENLSSLTVVEAAELSKQLEEKWGVTPMAAAAPAAAAGVTIQCPGCSTQLKITDTQRPLTVACPGCQTHLKLEQ